MSRKTRLHRLVASLVLIASAIQGMAPDAQTVVSPTALAWWKLPLSAGEGHGLCGRLPDDNPPAPAPIDDAGPDGSCGDVVVPVELHVSVVLSRRLAVDHSLPTGLATLDPFSARPTMDVPTSAHHALRSAPDVVSALCRSLC